eukprot:TRINITY_DN1262_c0_g1::TRINITY_DN1262_c0_g1_i1::g.26951::m.26951 TRINITY_DN1262_c0_g1::TRINITY_DN1262_c0_g1_i1::g.26951  ORF type:complete len:463 (-),score=98.43,sp/O28852/Y1420_ARCFU/24.55/2e-08,Band_7/PF01145.20/1.8e-19,Band_7/PF01145.20/2.7e+02 TRINITY_DN1262_c0_g1_i1:309-1655(-)
MGIFSCFGSAEPSHDHFPPGIGTRLIEVDNVDLSRAAAIFSQFRDGNRVPLVLVPTSRNPLSMALQVPSDAYVMMQRCGAHFPKDQKCFMGAGLFFLPPWWRIAYLVTKQAINYNAPVSKVPTQDNVNVEVNISIVFNIIDPYTFVYELGVLRFDEYLRSAIEEGIRILVRRTNHSELFDMKGEFAESMLRDLNDKFGGLGVSFSTVIVTEVKLPKDLMKLLSNIQDYRSQKEISERENQFQIKKLEDEHQIKVKELQTEHDKQMIEVISKKKQVLVERDSKVALEKDRRNIELIKADEETRVLIRNTESSVQETKTKTDADLKVAKVNAESKFLHAKSTLEAETNTRVEHAIAKDIADRKVAEREAKAIELKAGADYQVRENSIKADILSADAEAKAADAFKDKRMHEIALLKLDIRRKLMAQGKLVITGQQAHDFMGNMGEFINSL